MLVLVREVRFYYDPEIQNFQVLPSGDIGVMEGSTINCVQDKLNLVGLSDIRLGEATVFVRPPLTRERITLGDRDYLGYLLTEIRKISDLNDL